MLSNQCNIYLGGLSLLTVHKCIFKILSALLAFDAFCVNISVADMALKMAFKH